MSYRLYPLAIERHCEIWDYTADTWSPDRADSYIRSLHQVIRLAHANRLLWRAAPNMGDTYFIRHEHHHISFRKLGGGVLGVLTILHDSITFLRTSRKIWTFLPAPYSAA